MCIMNMLVTYDETMYIEKCYVERPRITYAVYKSVEISW
jgi:hypothetical protein